MFLVVGLSGTAGTSFDSVSLDGVASTDASFLSTSVIWSLANAPSRPFVFASDSSEGVGPGNGVLCASSTLSCPALLALAASVYPSGRDHQLVQPHAFAAASVLGGSGGSGGSSPPDVGSCAGGASVCFAVELSASSTAPSEETVILVVDVGSAKLLLDLRLVRNLAGESFLDFFASSLGSSEVAPPLTLIPMVSCAVFTTGGAFDRQLPVPPSHFRPLFGVCVPVVVGVDAPSGTVDDSDSGRLVVVSCDVVLASNVPILGSVVLLVVDTSAAISSAGA